MGHIVVTWYEYYVDLPEELDGYRIVQISDIHADLTDRKCRELYQKVVSAHPDIVVVTGDCVDRIHFKNQSKVEKLLLDLQKQRPLYIVSGNHEYMHSECFEFMNELEKKGLKILHNEYVDIHRGNACIRIYGIDDPYALYRGNIPKKYKTPTEEFKKMFRESVSVDRRDADCVILLAHRPEFFELYCEKDFDIIFTGHAHGGQWRIPCFGGLMAPDQGIFPKYVRGCHECGRTRMYVSRGLGNSNFPIRIFNNPELVVVEIKK